jgi:hypothetical protein
MYHRLLAQRNIKIKKIKNNNNKDSGDSDVNKNLSLRIPLDIKRASSRRNPPTILAHNNNDLSPLVFKKKTNTGIKKPPFNIVVNHVGKTKYFPAITKE